MVAMYSASRCCWPPESCLNRLPDSSSSPIARMLVGDPVAGEPHAVQAAEESGDLLDAQLRLEAGGLQLHAEPGLRLQRMLAAHRPRRPAPGPSAGLTSPSIALSVLVLPAPFGPSSPKISPRSIRKPMPVDRGPAAVGDRQVVHPQCRRLPPARPIRSSSSVCWMRASRWLTISLEAGDRAAPRGKGSCPPPLGGRHSRANCDNLSYVSKTQSLATRASRTRRFDRWRPWPGSSRWYCSCGPP